ncbi:molecular chaperone SurA [Seongchinamella sediminis]|uniref:Chaperone SurA n=1 Tax=Seongchinamella sediminis TaxID=2283635 RepID=A0A3L7DZA2_9GAMM|nr:peptidylprolyl isomerase [Seongchinamella sediminis]RLQ21172.1 molecular chaperone SurA [Seongchinamella sediminis]
MNIKTRLLGAILATAILASGLARAETEMLDQVVAVVDDDIIMASELRERVDSITQSIEARGVEMPPEDVIIRETLDRLILESIQLQKGQRVGVRITDAQLNAALQRVAAQNGMTLDQFRLALEEQGQSYQGMREQIRTEMIIQRVQQGNVNQRIEISDQEVDNFLATAEGQKMTQPEYQILHALLAVSPSAPAAEAERAEAYVDKVLAEIQAGSTFEAAVSAPGPYTFSGGNLGWRKLDDLPSLFSDVAPALAKGETQKVRSDSGFHLIYMADRRGDESMVVNQTRVRHILVKPSEIMTDQQARELVTDLKARAEGGEDFAELAREYSEDIGSAQEGGDLGWTSPGQMVPEFEQTMQITAIGEISDPVKSQFGWHILEVMDRREEDMTDRATRNKAMNYLHNRKYQEELDAWLRQIRDEAFVDIK